MLGPSSNESSLIQWAKWPTVTRPWLSDSHRHHLAAAAAAAAAGAATTAVSHSCHLWCGVVLLMHYGCGACHWQPVAACTAATSLQGIISRTCAGLFVFARALIRKNGAI